MAAAVSATAVSVTLAGPVQAAYPVGTLSTAVSNYVFSPDAVAGANDWSCKPTAAHPYPVVLVHGTGANLGANWVALAPTLANAGYCVFGFNYGETWTSLFGRIDGLGEIARSAQTMSDFVDRVLAVTGASKVDVVGHSQGGMMPGYYIKRLGGAAKVHTLVGMAPSNHGTTLDGLVTLGQSLHALWLPNDFFTVLGMPALAEQEAGSDFQNRLFGDGDTVAGVRYVVIETNHDAVVTPYGNAFLQGATNILIQNQCPNDPVGHAGLFLDGPTIQDILNVLGPNTPGFQPSCTNYGLGL